MNIPEELIRPAYDGREPIEVSHPYFDAPDGAVLDLGNDPAYPERHGHYQRNGEVWDPVTILTPVTAN